MGVIGGHGQFGDAHGIHNHANRLGLQSSFLLVFSVLAKSQRDSDSKPKVARHELPWKTWTKTNNPHRVAAGRCKRDATPLGLKILRRLTQGRRVAPTLGWRTESI